MMVMVLLMVMINALIRLELLNTKVVQFLMVMVTDRPSLAVTTPIGMPGHAPAKSSVMRVTVLSPPSTVSASAQHDTPVNFSDVCFTVMYLLRGTLPRLGRVTRFRLHATPVVFSLHPPRRVPWFLCPDQPHQTKEPAPMSHVPAVAARPVSVTVAYLRSSRLSLCYSDADLQGLVDRLAAGETPVAVLLSLPRPDALRVVCGLLPSAAAEDLAQFAARRARGYAYAAYAAYADDADAYAAYADDADAYAAYAYAYAAYAAADAAYAADDDQECSIRYGAMLLGLGVD